MMSRFDTSTRSSLIPDPIARQPWAMLIPLFLLVIFGSLVLYSAAGGNLYPFAASHLIRFFILMVITTILSSLPLLFIKHLAYPVYFFGLFLLVLVELTGSIGGGSQRWLDLGVIRLQPSELIKPIIVLTIAKFYSNLPPVLTSNWRAIIIPSAIMALPVALILRQPDLGTSLAILAGGIIVMFLAGIPFKWFIKAAGLVLLASPFLYHFALSPYMQRRVTTFFNPESDPLGAGYHIAQSKIAIGSGGLTGKGFNEGSQSHLNYLPEPHTDFVFSAMVEEWGLLGGGFALAMFTLIILWGWNVARASTDRFAMLLAGGSISTIFLYIAINLMMVMGLAPIVGIPLPWISHGGSSMLTNMICIGLLMMVNAHNRKAPRKNLLS